MALIIGVSSASLAGSSISEDVDIALSLGFDGIEISMDKIGDWENAVGLVKGKFKHITIHSLDIDYKARDERIRDESMGKMLKTIEFAERIGAKAITIHDTNLSAWSIEEFFKISRQALEKLLSKATVCKVKLGIENPAYGSMEKMLQAVNDFNSEWLGITIDTGHLQAYPEVYGMEKNVESINKILEKLVYIFQGVTVNMHVHDCRLEDGKDHLPLREGDVDWNRFAKTVKETGYSAGLMFEMHPIDINGIMENKKYLESLVK